MVPTEAEVLQDLALGGQVTLRNSSHDSSDEVSEIGGDGKVSSPDHAVSDKVLGLILREYIKEMSEASVLRTQSRE
jgi:hypothetical protein